ncbi:E3 ubiquitin-protein ligase TRIM39-like [Sebastes umbrosus]|uniref:E3 ubiquitin-protein ligase TRIM39-like n=1 Tax=Sebastes umbrosus TaxID=72105 RepID=UPI00189F4812|nr:E3 ubiquitin-protein ligase TRIM39-like [Sebastes umbrosus]XP_037630382.1 E3 ubiquitin-protein ligase TRIM39-like [Sebastes umbrosus]
MASANISRTEEQFLCPICREVFTDPVSTPCGHNYCKSCITGYCATSDFSHCPLCMETFPRATGLQVNTAFRDMVEHFKRTRPGEVPCDLCHGMKRKKALKSCLVCLVSYCDAHLAPHHTVNALKRHDLVDPVENLEDRVCKTHNKVMEFFCRKDQSCVCFLCLKDDHVMHNTVSLEEEGEERKTTLKCTKRQVEHDLSKKCHLALRIQNSMVQGRQEVEETKVETVKAFTALVASIKKKKVKLMQLLEEKQKAAEQKAEALVRQLWLEVAEDRRMSTKLEELSKTEDYFKLLLPSIPSPSNTSFTEPRRLLQVETVRSAVAKMEETLNEQMENIIKEVDEEETVEEPVFDDELGKIQEKYAVSVTLDPDTAHPSLIVSEDRKQVRDGGTKRNVLDNPARFYSFHYVLGDKGFSSGRFYYEVTLTGQTGWEVGVARESISKKSDHLSLSPENGCWTLGLYWGRCQANTNPPVPLSLCKELQKVGVFVDYEGGLVSFYDVDTRAQIYAFTGCVFTAPAPFLSNLWSLAVRTAANTRIYPLIRPSAEEGSAPLQITPVTCTKGKQ